MPAPSATARACHRDAAAVVSYSLQPTGMLELGAGPGGLVDVGPDQPGLA